MSADRPLKVALFGSGRIGHVHARNILANPDLELAAIADPYIEGAQALAAGTGAVAVATADEVFAIDGLDAIIIGSPTNTHVDLISRAAAHGVATLCEKPIDLDIDRVLSCRESLRGSHTPLMLGFNRRFDPNFSSVQARVQAGEIGKLEQLTIISRDPAPAPAGYIATSGGIFRDQSIHDLDMARFFVPDIIEVSATGSNLFCDYIEEAGDFDSVVITLRGSGGEQITIINSRHSAFGHDQRLEAFGSEGMLTAGNLTPTSVRKFTAAGAEEADPYLNFFLERYAQAYRAELDNFVQSIRTGVPCSPGFDDGVQALVLANAAEESARSGRVVKVGKE
ncbi:myo-inositol 2-dehydrogenase/D-chiro-inositol 1-dehydrogenase [Arthrobacter sp. SLBN-112]|jgi:myo-inositol 2-dehydrogenase / D-chiro-inositol 1-dehydrogenase|uniref:inositol 2-dehydrogenase n=1 Tax=Arthrobacter sp. SLBN-112 TaxID=2768452 RepID=UPI001150D9CF|nr:inositol 2-dehydrogenase [Arthrobacter sp. SLBN-112]TQJ39341.1 myo-inositol 2-dehydrogenase/D-chiro-inositol 1-dehydrogenase [Arthrobacter sp. SLBN-112]